MENPYDTLGRSHVMWLIAVTCVMLVFIGTALLLFKRPDSPGLSAFCLFATAVVGAFATAGGLTTWRSVQEDKKMEGTDGKN